MKKKRVMFPLVVFRNGKIKVSENLHAKNEGGFKENERQLIDSQGNYDLVKEAAAATGHLEQHLEQESWETYEAVNKTSGPPIETPAMIQSLEEFARAEGGWETYDRENLTGRTAIGRRMMANMAQRHGVMGGRYAVHRLGQRHLSAEMGGVKATLTMNVVRLSYNIPYNLIAPMWNVLDILTGGQSAAAIQQQYASGGTFLGATFAIVASPGINPGDLVLTYGLTTNLAITDTVVIHTQETEYIAHMYGIVCGAVLQVGGGPAHKPGGQAVLSDPTQAQSQWNTQWYFYKKNFMGSYTQKPLNGGYFIDSHQYQLGYQDIKIGFPVDYYHGICLTCIFIPGYNSQLSVSFQWSFSVVDYGGYKKHNHAGHRHHYESAAYGNLDQRFEEYEKAA